MAGGAPGLRGPRNCRSRSPCPWSPCRSPGGLPAPPHSGHRPGRTASTDGGASSHLLMSTSLRAIDLPAPHPRMVMTAAGPRPEGRCRAPPVTYFWPFPSRRRPRPASTTIPSPAPPQPTCQRRGSRRSRRHRRHQAGSRNGPRTPSGTPANNLLDRQVLRQAGEAPSGNGWYDRSEIHVDLPVLRKEPEERAK